MLAVDFEAQTAIDEMYNELQQEGTNCWNFYRGSVAVHSSGPSISNSLLHLEVITLGAG